MTSRLGRNAAVYAGASVLQKASSLVLLPVYTRLMTPETFGFMNLIVSFTLFASVIPVGGLEHAVVRFCGLTNGIVRRRKCFSSAVQVVVLATAVIVVLLRISVSLYQELVFPGLPDETTLNIVFVGLLFQPTSVVLLAYFQAVERAVLYGWVSVSCFLLTGVSTVFLVGPAGLGVRGVALGYLLGYSATVVGLLGVVLHQRVLTFRVSPTVIREMVSYSVPLVPHNLSQQLSVFGTKVAVSHGVSVAALGMFNIAQYLTNVIDTIQNSLHRAFLPWFYRAAGKGPDAALDYCGDRVTLMICANSIVCVGVSVLAPPLLAVATGSDYSIPNLVVPILCLSMMIKSLYYPNLSCLLYGKKSSRHIFWISASSTGIGVPLSYILAGALGLVGAAISQLVQRLLLFGLSQVFARHDGWRIVPMWRVLRVQFVSLSGIVAGASLDLGGSDRFGAIALLLRGGILVAAISMTWAMERHALDRVRSEG